MIYSTDHSRIYDDFVRDLTADNSVPYIRYPDEYHDQEIAKLCVSQHSGITSDKEQRQITDYWINFLSAHTLPLKEVQLCTAVNQKVFDALCCQESLEILTIKWFTGKEISRIKRLKNLKVLYIERAPSLETITPLCLLTSLEVLILCHTLKVGDYSCLEKLKSLRVLGICAARISCDGTKIRASSLDFINNMSSLEYVDILDVAVKQHDTTAN